MFGGQNKGYPIAEKKGATDHVTSSSDIPVVKNKKDDYRSENLAAFMEFDWVQQSIPDIKNRKIIADQCLFLSLEPRHFKYLFMNFEKNYPNIDSLIVGGSLELEEAMSFSYSFYYFLLREPMLGEMITRMKTEEVKQLGHCSDEQFLALGFKRTLAMDTDLKNSWFMGKVIEGAIRINAVLGEENKEKLEEELRIALLLNNQKYIEEMLKQKQYSIDMINRMFKKIREQESEQSKTSSAFSFFNTQSKSSSHRLLNTLRESAFQKLKDQIIEMIETNDDTDDDIDDDTAEKMKDILKTAGNLPIFNEAYFEHKPELIREINVWLAEKIKIVAEAKPEKPADLSALSPATVRPS